jgi:hypothetical protein
MAHFSSTSRRVFNEALNVALVLGLLWLLVR